MDAAAYKSAFRAAVEQVRSEGRYRVFADLKRQRGAFPRATWVAPGGAEKDVVVWCSNDYLGQGQNPVVLDAMHAAVDAAPGGPQGLSCAGYGSLVTVTAAMGMAAAGQAIHRLVEGRYPG